MSKELNARINRYLLIRRIKENLLLAIVAPLAVAGLVVFALNQPIAQATVEGRFVRWTVAQDHKFTPLPIVYCDLRDGRTVAATAGTNWVPPQPGDIIKVEEQQMFWSGLRCRIP